MNRTDNVIGANIAKLRKEKGLLQRELSSILHMSPSNISNYENNAYWPDLKTVCRMADYFGVTTDYLLGRTDYRCPPEMLSEYITSDYTVHNIVNTLLCLDSSSLDAAVKYINFLKESNAVSRKNNGKNGKP